MCTEGRGSEGLGLGALLPAGLGGRAGGPGCWLGAGPGCGLGCGAGLGGQAAGWAGGPDWGPRLLAGYRAGLRGRAGGWAAATPVLLLLHLPVARGY